MLGRGRQIHGGRNIRAGDLRLLGRIVWHTVIHATPRRAWFTLSLVGATLLRRPSRIKEAVSFAIVHKAFYEYMVGLGEHLDAAIPRTEATQPELLPVLSPESS